MAGLDNIKKFQEGGGASTEGGLPAAAPTFKVTAPKATGISDKISMDPTQTEAILAQMQRMIDERESPFAKFASGLSKGMATAYGPGSLAAFEREKELQDKQTMDYRTQMAAYRAAQAQAQRDAQKWAQYGGGQAPGGAGAGAAPGGGVMDPSGVFIPASQIQKEALANSPADKIALRQEYLKTLTTETTKADLNPSSLDRKDVIVLNPQTKEYEVQQVNRFEYEQLKRAGLIPDAASMYGVPQGGKPAAPTAPAAPTMQPTAAPREAALPSIQKAVYQTESSSGTADTTKPGPQGAVGPMQVTPATFDTAKNLKLIPADYDVNNPAQNKEAGNKLLEHYYKQYNGDVDKVLAAYIGGPGAINKDGTINYDRKDALGTTIREYIDKNKKAMGLTTAEPGMVKTSAVGKGMPSVAAIKAQQEAEKEEMVSAAKKRGESAEKQRETFELDTDPTTLDEAYATSRRIQTLVKGDPSLSGVINQPGVAAAVAGVLEKGIGNYGIADLENAIYKALPETTRKSIGERSELITYLARIELQTAKLIKGQGQITEGEREILQRASASIKDPAELIYKKARALERTTQMYDELSKVYGDGANFKDFRKFKNDPKFKEIHDRYRKDLLNIFDEKVDLRKSVPGAAPAKPKHPTDIQDIINRNKPKTTP